jgi:hypothetical protein
MIRKKLHIYAYIVIAVLNLASCKSADTQVREKNDFTKGGAFFLGNEENAKDLSFDDSGWRKLNLPHDWSIGNEIPEQWGDSTGTSIATELSGIVKRLDTTRPITVGINEPLLHVQE